MVACPKCKADLPVDRVSGPEFVACPVCVTPVRGVFFPALFRKIDTVDLGETVVVEGESSCFFHPSKRAAVACEACGRFLCSLCDVDLDGRHMCATCLESGKKKGREQNLQDTLVRHDSIALGLCLLPVLLWPITIVTAPMAVYISIRHWNSPGGILPRRAKVRFVIAIILGTLQVSAWVLGIGYAISSN
ncbi:MAG TPA: hypothetical protein VK968_11880 [Roseimicrobium sp.]|nr:hypothetical protein [Roseimicrobium sp.]